MKLEEIRKKIDNLDEKLLIILAKRFRLAQKAKNAKEKLGLSLVDKNREKEIRKRIREKSKELNLSFKFALKIFKEIITESKRLQRRK